MADQTVVIPEKIYFKIGEVCELLDVQAHVLRYWETEFAVLSPQKNKSGQRSYRRRDVEIALRIKQLLYSEMFTIAGARKKLQAEARQGNKSKVRGGADEPVSNQTDGRQIAPTLFDNRPEVADDGVATSAPAFQGDQQEAVKALATHLLELRELLKPKVS